MSQVNVAENVTPMGADELATKLAQEFPSPWQLEEYMAQIKASPNPRAYGHQVFLAYMVAQSARGHRVGADDLIVPAHSFLHGIRTADALPLDEVHSGAFEGDVRAFNEANVALIGLRGLILSRTET